MARAVNIESDKTLPKKRKTRKPMSAEQKKAAGERLAIAREKRLAANPQNINQSTQMFSTEAMKMHGVTSM